uniref:Polyphosphate kinase n=1 Tax=Candidatus Kentrum sp. SD TaxID=2126332 RepID=A0A450YL16_9GAMM|nr:MAG: polyphosphate kinase [Candidatus Kentron sp. SD]VFK48302.1 MAG: polyphosphate kinase [Candidatus Kentron sp. SD]VFK79721.1 MAG: polyphosphate kinase [Candidatus Kentron sp. SD]
MSTYSTSIQLPRVIAAMKQPIEEPYTPDSHDIEDVSSVGDSKTTSGKKHEKEKSVTETKTETKMHTEENKPDGTSYSASEFDLNSPELYLNRELTWINFNRRVLHEAGDQRTPLLERVKFLAIVSSNVDEFFMKRIGGLKQQLAAGLQRPTVDGRTPARQITECHAQTRDIRLQREEIYRALIEQLTEHDIHLVKYRTLDEHQQTKLREHFIRSIFPLVTPLAMDPGHPFPFISNLAINLLVTLRYPGGTGIYMARVKVPLIKGVAPRFLRVGEKNTFVTLDDVMASNLDLLFPGMEIESCDLFRVTRNANVEMDEEAADDLLEMIQSELRERHFAPIVRLEVMPGMNPMLRGMLTAELGLDADTDVFEVEGMLAMRDLFEITMLDVPELHDAPHRPIDHTRLAHNRQNIFHIIRKNPLLLQHPYESFTTSVERFLRTASHDPKVLAIKMTLYRTSSSGNIITSLIEAAQNGKQVAVLVELKARFDEAANIRWARRLEQAGIHVTYGVIGFKTHSKIILVVRKDYDGIKRYAHIGTGNYHADTARLYGDLGILTDDKDIGQDLTELFNFLTGYSSPFSYRKILAAPYTLKRALLEKIDREISRHTPDSPGLIQFKTNALEDFDITKALYRACQAGVRVDLIVRDTCRLRPGIPGLSETAHVISVVGRFLEHTRIYYFRNGGEEEYYIGSADLMKRNLESRVEVVTPVENSDLRQDLRMMLDVQLADRRSVWELQSDGNYTQRKPGEGQETHGSQDTLISIAETRLAAALKHKQGRIRRKLVNRFQKRLKTMVDGVW